MGPFLFGGDQGPQAFVWMRGMGKNKRGWWEIVLFLKKKSGFS